MPSRKGSPDKDLAPRTKKLLKAHDPESNVTMAHAPRRNKAEARSYLAKWGMNMVDRIIEITTSEEWDELPHKEKLQTIELALKYGIGQEQTIRVDKRGVVESVCKAAIQFFEAKGIEMSRDDWIEFGNMLNDMATEEN
jgi:hypothetical protein